MSVAVQDLNDYRRKVAGLDPSHFIGSILWFSIAGAAETAVANNTIFRQHVPVRVTRDQLALWFEELGLDPKFLPPAGLKVDAFRRASTETERSHKLSQDETERLYTKEVDSNPEFVLRHVIREITNSKAKVVYTAQVASLKFLRGARTSAGKRVSAQHYVPAILTTLVEIGIDGKPTGVKAKLQPDERKRVEEFIAAFDTRYHDLYANLTAQALRAVIRNYVTSLNAISMRSSGGVYFVHSSRQETVDALEELVSRFGPGCSLDQMPLVDMPKQRAMLTEAFQDEVENECQSLLKALMEVEENAKAKKSKVKASQYATLKNQFDEVIERSEEYTRVLGLAQGRSAAAIELAMQKLVDLVDNLETGSK